MNVLDRFSPATRAWFEGAFHQPTTAQEQAWDAIADGKDTLVVAPTGSGKTLAAFLWSIDAIARQPTPEPKARLRTLYISPLKALGVDVERNLTAPLTGIRHAAARLGESELDLRVGVRSGDTGADERRRLAAKPPDILITTPESLFLMLTSQARESLRSVETVIVDEVHAVLSTKRGAHLALSLERLDALLHRPAQRIGLSATVRPLDEVARFLGGSRDVTIVAPPTAKTIEVSVRVPIEDMSALGEIVDEVREGSASGPAARASIWPATEAAILDLVEGHRSTIIFANSRRLAERLTSRLNEIAFERANGEVLEITHSPAALMGGSGVGFGDHTEVARAHHGSVSREQRALTEDALKQGRLPAVVATGTLELGIDMGAVDLVVQVEAPPSVASALQRVGRAGHQVGAISRGVIFPKYRGDLVTCAVVAERMTAGDIEAMHYPRNALDVLAQQIVAMTALEDWDVDELLGVVRKAAPFHTLPASAFEATLDMIAGRYPSDDFAELRPRITWDRVANRISARPGAQRLAVTSGGTIPDRGLFGVFLIGERKSRVGELDEEMVYESRVGDVFLLGSSSWRIEEITHDQVLVSPAPGQAGRMPFWKGDSAGRPYELGRAQGAYLREMSSAGPGVAEQRAVDAGLDHNATSNLLAYLAEQRVATGACPDDRTVVVERFHDELGDWRLVIHSPFGAQVNGPWALAIGARLRETYDSEAQILHSDDGIVIRLPETDNPPDAAAVIIEPDEVDAIVQAELGGSALFASRFRECAARALLLPRRNPGKRTPLWQQRQRSATLLEVAARYPTFPIVLEAMRECLQDVYDVPALISLMRDVQSRAVRVIEVETPQPSPFARSLLFGYIGTFMYEGDSPLAERRAAALSLDATLLAELLGQSELRDLLDPQALADVEQALQLLNPSMHPRDVEGGADVLRRLGDLTTDEAAERGVAKDWLEELEAARRIIQVRIAGDQRWLPVEDAGRVLDALGVALPVGVPEVFLAPVEDPLGDLVSRYARTHGPFVVTDLAARYGLGTAVVSGALARLAVAGRLVQGEFRPGGVDLEWCDAGVLRRIRRASLAALRAEVAPVEPEVLARFLPLWQGIGVKGSSYDALLRTVDQLQGAVVPASALESLILPSRVPGYLSSMLDELTASGEVLWAGAGQLTGGDGWITLALADSAPLVLPEPGIVSVEGADAVLAALESGAALFARQITERTGILDPTAALWDLVFAGLVTNDTLAPLRARLAAGAPAAARAAAPRRPGGRARPARLSRPVLSAPTAAGRWSMVAAREPDQTRRAVALADLLLERHGVLTRSAVMSERIPGGFQAVYPVLRAAEEAGRARRGHFVAGLGAAQFARAGAVDRMRDLALRDQEGVAQVLAATDPANVYGAAVGWPATSVASLGGRAGHRPGRKAGALVVLVDGRLVLYVERGGKTLLTFTGDDRDLALATKALADAVRQGVLGRIDVERADGEFVLDSPLSVALEAAGFRPTPRGLRLRR